MRFVELAAVARLDLGEVLRSRWLVLCLVLYALLGGVFVLVGLRESNVLGFTGVGRVLFSLCHALVLFLPLLALLASVQAVNRARDDGSLELFLSHPIGRGAYLAGVAAGSLRRARASARGGDAGPRGRSRLGARPGDSLGLLRPRARRLRGAARRLRGRGARDLRAGAPPGQGHDARLRHLDRERCAARFRGHRAAPRNGACPRPRCSCSRSPIPCRRRAWRCSRPRSPRSRRSVPSASTWRTTSAARRSSRSGSRGPAIVGIGGWLVAWRSFRRGDVV